MNKHITAQFLNEQRAFGDPPADELIQKIIENDKVNSINHIFSMLHDNSDDEKFKKLPTLGNYLNEIAILPEWADEKMLEHAEREFMRHGPNMIMAYFCKSLPECYACANGAEVLLSTGRLTNNIRRRIAKTAQFVLDVTTPDGLSSNGKGVVTAQKVRLMHASIRYYIQLHGFDKEKYGYPINQEDIAGTMLAFSVVVIEGAKKLGSKFSRKDEEAILHMKKCVGHIIGLKGELQPANIDEAELMWNFIIKAQFAESEQGKELNNSLVNLLEEVIPGTFLDSIVPYMMKYLVEPEAIDILALNELKQSKGLGFLTRSFLFLIESFEGSSILSRILFTFINMKLLYGLEKYIAADSDTQVVIPKSLSGNWDHSSPISTSIFRSKEIHNESFDK